MKALIKLLISAFLAINCQILSATSIEVQDTIFINTTWNVDTVKVDCDIVVDSAAILTVAPGTVVEFQGYYKIDIYSRLIAKGTETDSIKFTVNDTIGFHDTGTTTGGWKCINIIGGADSSFIEYAKFEFAKKPELLSSMGYDTLGVINLINSNARISNSAFENNNYIFGSAIYSYNAGTKIHNNRFNFNKCTPVTITENSNSVITDNDISYNEDIRGNKVSKSEGYGSVFIRKSDVRIENNNISNNNSTGIRIRSCKFYIRGNNIENNLGDGISFICYICEFFLKTLEPETSSGDIVNNKILGNAYGIYFYTNHVDGKHINITGNIICNNRLGIIIKYSNYISITNNTISNNYYQGIYQKSTFMHEIKNTILTGNDPINGIQLYITPRILMSTTNETISNNYDHGTNLLSSHVHEIEDTILTDNDQENGCQLYNNTDVKMPINYISFYNCVVQGGKDGIGGIPIIGDFENCLDIDPAFTDPGNRDYSLADISYCIDAGTTDTSGLNLPAVDFWGNPRIYKGEQDIIDIGAYEYQGERANRPPVLSKTEDTLIFCIDTLQMQAEYFDPDIFDTHTITITADTPFVSINNLTGDTSGSTYEITSAHDWTGFANIYVQVTDNFGAKDIDTFSIAVTNHFCGTISENTTWDMDTVKVDCDIVIDSIAVLTIEPGTRIEFNDYSHIKIKGRLLAQGNDSNRIVFASGNHARWGGIRFEDIPSSNDSSKLICCDIEGAYIDPIVVFPENLNINGAAIYVEDFNKLLISGCDIRYNYSIKSGGGIYILNSDIILKNNNIYENVAEFGSGGGLYISNSNPLLINNVISRNSPNGIAFRSNSNGKLINNLICNNNVEGIHISAASPEIINNTICNNKEGLACGFGSNPVIKNSIFRGNTLHQIFLYKDNNHPEIEYCNIQGGLDDIPFNSSIYVYENNIDLEPYFTDINNMDYTLSDSSYCINTGTTDTTGMNLPPFDIIGNPRIYDGTIDIIDIGAYEYQGDPVNHPPLITGAGDQKIMYGTIIQMNVEYLDPDIIDTHTISLTSDLPYISFNNLSGDTSGSTYEIIPDHNWTGMANIYVEVTDIYEANDIDTFSLEVTNHFCGRVTGNVTWELDTIKIDCDIVVDSNAVLTIEPGTVVEFQGEYMIDVQGRLVAEGTQVDPIIYTVSDTSGYHINEHDRWKELRFVDIADTSQPSVLKYCILEYNINSSINVSDYNKLTISDCIIRYGDSYGIEINESVTTVKNCKIYNNYTGISIQNSGSNILNNVIFNNSDVGIRIPGASPEIINNTICNNSDGISCAFGSTPVVKNSIIWGNTRDQIFLYKDNNHPEIEYCNIQGGLDNIPFNSSIYVYENNLDLEPYFTDINIMDYTLSDSSYCINTGIPDTAGMNLPGSDIAGNPRIYDGTRDIIDIGAYEYQGEPANRPPVLTKTEDAQNLANTIFKSEVNYFDPDINDSHTVLITTDSPNIQIFELAQGPGSFVYEVIPGLNWLGTADIYIKVTDNQGAEAADTFRLAFTKHVCGTITDNTTWHLDTVKVDCDIIIDSAATLTIEPGTVVEFQGAYKINVKGRLLAVGTPADYITFTASDTSGYNNNSYTGWAGIVFYFTNPDSDTSKLIYCNIEYAKNTQSYPDYYGGAVGIKNFSKLVISRCLIRYNYAEYGGAIAVCDAQPVIDNNYILCNNGSSGAGIYLDCFAKLHNNVICNNNGEGIHISGASPEIVNNTVCYNKEGLACGFGSDPIIKNNIFRGNTLHQIFLYKDNNHPEIEYCNIQGGLDNIPFGYSISIYENNLDLDPYFTDTSIMDYSLSDSSSCINRGTPDATGLNLPPFDIAGNPRIIGDTIDIGACEYLINFAPTDIMLSDNGVAENVMPGSVVGLFSTVDTNDADTHTYSFDTGDGTNDIDNSSFIISHDSLKINLCPDHEEKDTFRIFVKTTDNGDHNLSTSKAFIINILDINEPPLIIPQSFSVDENSPSGTVVDTVKAYDPDEGQTLSYSIISGNTDDAFAVDLFTGEISVNDSLILDFETTPVFGLAMQVQDDGPGNLTGEALITINLNDVYEPVNLNTITAGMFRIYPNPVNKSFYIEFPGDHYDNLIVEINSINGSLVYLKEMNELSGSIKAEIDVSSLPAGMYVLTLKNNKIIVTRKIEIIR